MFIQSHPEQNMFSFVTKNGELSYPRTQVLVNNQLYQWTYPYHEVVSGTEYTKAVVLFPNIINFHHHSKKDRSHKFKEYMLDSIDILILI